MIIIQMIEDILYHETWGSFQCFCLHFIQFCIESRSLVLITSVAAVSAVVFFVILKTNVDSLTEMVEPWG